MPVETLFNAVRFVSHSSNVLVHQLFLSSSYLNAVLDRFEPCFKLQLGLPHGPSRSDLFMSPSIILPRTGRDLSAVRMKMEGIYGGDVERIIVWIDGNYKPITSFQVTWLTRDPAKQHSKRAQEDVVTVSRGGWYEGDVDWFAIFQNMSKCRAREPGNYGNEPPFLARSMLLTERGEYLLFSPLGKAHGWSQNPLPSLLQRSERSALDIEASS